MEIPTDRSRSERARVIALAAAFAAAATALHAATMHVPALARADVRGYSGFLGLRTNDTLALGDAIVSTADPAPTRSCSLPCSPSACASAACAWRRPPAPRSSPPT